MCLILDSLIQERQRLTETSPVKYHRNDQEIGASDTQGRVERYGIVQPAEERLKYRSYQCISIPDGRRQRTQSQTFLGSFQGNDKRQWPQTEMQEIPLTIRKNIFTMRMVTHKLRRDTAEFSSKKIFKIQLDVTLSNIFQLTLAGTWDLMFSTSSFQLHPFRYTVYIFQVTYIYIFCKLHFSQQILNPLKVFVFNCVCMFHRYLKKEEPCSENG